jgi:hypothetical protein
MGFVVGLLLMYMPEQLAFHIFSTLMSQQGCNLRRLYLDGLSALKHEMAKFDWLLSRHHPRLSKHLQQHCVPCVLYVSQWLLTSFACPFPAYFAAQLVDIMLTESSDRIVMQACSQIPSAHMLIPPCAAGVRSCLDLDWLSVRAPPIVHTAELSVCACTQLELLLPAAVQTAMAIMAEVEERLLRLSEFEDIITCIKSDPAQWSDSKLRGILTAAYLSSVSEEELQLASDSVTSAAIESMLVGGPPALEQPHVQSPEAADAGSGEGEADDVAARAQTPLLSSAANSMGSFVELNELVRSELTQLTWAEAEEDGGGGKGHGMGVQAVVHSLRRDGGGSGVDRPRSGEVQAEGAGSLEEPTAQQRLHGGLVPVRSGGEHATALERDERV